MDFCYKIFGHDSEKILAISDKDILGKRFEEDGLQIEVTHEFYQDKECNEKEALKLIRSSTIINAVGKKIIALMIKENVIEKGNIITIDGVPHAQVIEL